ncbi:MAG: hypothetical protein RIB98_04640 [Acidimicrobiales bacterium]
MNEDDLRNRLGRLDPASDDVAVESLTTPSSRARLEQIMNTPTSPETDRPDVPPDALAIPASSGRWLVAAAAALVLLVVAGFAIANLGDDDGSEVAAEPPLELDLGADDPMASCLRAEPEILAEMSPAFAGTATAIEGETVTLTVDRWYAGGDDATTVELQAQPGMEALIAGFSFEVGEQYLITATDGTVNFCGYSGPATPEFLAFFDEAFPA